MTSSIRGRTRREQGRAGRILGVVGDSPRHVAHRYRPLPGEPQERRRLEYYCKNCEYVEDADPSEWCVFVSENTFSSKDKTVVMQDVIADPTLPRTKDVTCEMCGHKEAVFISESTEKGMTLSFVCVACKHRWKDYI